MMEGYLDFLTNNGERYFPYVRVEGIIDTDGSAFSNWIAKMNIHNHDVRYAMATHNHDNRYSLKTHEHAGYATSNHEHNYAGSSSSGGAATSAMKLAEAITVSFKGAISGSVSLDGSKDIEINTTVTHNHDEQYIGRKGNSIVNVGGASNAFTITGGTNNTKIIMNNGGESSGSIGYNDSGAYMSFNDKIFRVNGDGVYYNGKQLADVQFVLDNSGGGGGSTDIEMLKSIFAAISHAHTTADITNMPSKMANPNPITFSISGSDTVYDGSSAATILIDPSALGCAPANHDHDYSAVYSAIDHNHDSNYLLLNGSTRFKGSKLTFDTPLATDFVNDYIYKYLNFYSSDDAPDPTIGNIGCTYIKSGDNVKVQNVYLSVNTGNTMSSIAVNMTGAYVNNNEILDTHHMGHKDASYVGTAIDADKLDGLHASEFVRNSSVVHVGLTDKSNLDIDTSGAQGIDLMFKNEAGYYLSMKTKDTALETTLDIQSNGQTLFMITRDKSTGAIRTDLFGDIYHDGKQVQL